VHDNGNYERQEGFKMIDTASIQKRVYLMTDNQLKWLNKIINRAMLKRGLISVE
jgi:hypothetical protein